MLCSKCNAPILPVVALDIDGTMAKYHEHFIQFASEYLDRKVSPNFAGGSLADHLGVSPETYRSVKLAYRQGGGKRLMPPFPEAIALARWCHQRSELWITTTRPYNRFDSTDPDTREWLRRNGVDFSGLLYDDDKYEKLRTIVGAERVAVIVDDLPENVNRASELGLPAVLVSRPYNRAATLRPDVVRASSLVEVRIQVAHRVNEWKRGHGTD